jgi:4,5-dihydroxyphthalate decarboxylase
MSGCAHSSRNEMRALMGEDFWPYGVDSNRKVLDYFLDQHHAQGLSKRRVAVDELFHAATYESLKLRLLSTCGSSV